MKDNHGREIRDELTTAMHAEFLEGEISYDDLRVMGVYGLIKNGVPKKEALKKYEMTESFYDNNVDRVIFS